VSAPATLTEVWIYPVKGLRGHRVERATVEARGLVGDRRCMVVDARGRFVTQREHPNLVRLRATWEEGSVVLADDRSRESIALTERGAEVTVTVWSSTVLARELPRGSAWLARALGGDYRLVVLPDDVVRAVTSASGRAGDQVSFADAFPVLLASESSRRDLERRAGCPLVMERFRPNLVVDGLAPWSEDDVERFVVGALSLANRKPCDRCSVTTIDPETAATGKEPLKTLATFRARDGKVYFGVNLVPQGDGVVAVGDIVVTSAGQ
jgi:uncharacterized protein YcbX